MTEGMLQENVLLLRGLCTLTEETLGHVTEITHAVQRIARVKTGKREKSVARQNECWRIWEAGRRNPSVLQNSPNGHVRYADVFNFYRKELLDVGIKTVQGLEESLRRRTKRLSRTTSNRTASSARR